MSCEPGGVRTFTSLRRLPVAAWRLVATRCFRRAEVWREVARIALGLALVQPSCEIAGDTPFISFDLETGVAITDINDDGASDLVVASTHFEGPPPHPGTITVYLQNRARPGTFSGPATYAAGPYPVNLVIADLNRDGSKDVITVGEESPYVYINFGKPFAHGVFDSAVAVACGPSPHDVAVGDLNRDVVPDVAVGLYNNTVGSITVLFQDPAHPGTFARDTTFSSVTTSLGIAIGDVDGDGVPDIAATGRDNIWVLSGRTSAPGEFAAPVAIQAGVRPQDLAIGDVNGDGRNDIVVANAGSAADGTGSTLSVITGLSAVRNYPSPDGARVVVTADLNGDARTDIALAALVYQSQAPGKVAVWMQDTAGALHEPVLSTGGTSSDIIAAGDLNGDARPDLVITHPLLVAFQDTAAAGRFFPFVALPR